MKIAICFRGIPRSLTHTIQSIRANVISPLKAQGEVRIFTHLFNQTTIDNPRSGEKGQLDVKAHQLLESDWLDLEPPGQCLEGYGFEQIKSFGDPWNDNFASVRNLIHELHSLKQGWLAAKEWQPNVYFFLRPDLHYHQSLLSIFQSIQRERKTGLCVPLWQGWGGCNDRYAVASTSSAADAYASRVDHLHDYCQTTSKPPHAEKFLLNRLQKLQIPIWFTTIKATRVRSQGGMAKENYRWLRKSNLPAIRHAFATRFGKP